ncbi:MAG: D-glycerate dehydrogenase [bacterium]
MTTEKPEVLVTRRLPEAGMEMLEESCRLRLWEEDRPMPAEKIMERAEGVEGIVCLLSDPMGKEVMDAAGPGLKVISTMAVGYDNIDVAEATRRGVRVGHTPGVLTEATADLTWALILSLSRRIVEGDRMVRQGKFKGWSPTLLLGGDFYDKTLGIIGMGRIGSAVARRAFGFGMKVLYHNRKRLSEEEEGGASYAYLSTLVESSDYITIHCPLNEESRHLIGEEELSRMKPAAYLVNVGRGPVVDEKALVRALQERRIAGAAFDVYENEPELAPGLSELDNAVLAPHLGSASVETRSRMAIMTAENLIAGLEGKPLPWCVNPE